MTLLQYSSTQTPERPFTRYSGCSFSQISPAWNTGQEESSAWFILSSWVPCLWDILKIATLFRQDSGWSPRDHSVILTAFFTTTIWLEKEEFHVSGQFLNDSYKDFLTWISQQTSHLKWDDSQVSSLSMLSQSYKQKCESILPCFLVLVFFSENSGHNSLSLVKLKISL